MRVLWNPFRVRGATGCCWPRVMKLRFVRFITQGYEYLTPSGLGVILGVADPG